MVIHNPAKPQLKSRLTDGKGHGLKSLLYNLSVFPSVRASHNTCTWAGIILAHNAIPAGQLFIDGQCSHPRIIPQTSSAPARYTPHLFSRQNRRDTNPATPEPPLIPNLPIYQPTNLPIYQPTNLPPTNLPPTTLQSARPTASATGFN